jgi:hypothetical protein
MKKAILAVSLFVLLMIPCVASAGVAVYTYNPDTQNFELYPHALLICDTSDSVGNWSCLNRYATDNFDGNGETGRDVLRAWYAALVSAKAMGTTIGIVYETTTGKIYSIRGPN